MNIASRTLMALVLSTALISPVLAQTAPTDAVIAIEAAQIPGDFSAAISEAAAGRALFLAGDHSAGLEMLQPLADAGNPVAQNILGIALTEVNAAYGTYDAAEGFRYLLAAGAQNFSPAMHNLGDTFEETHEGFAPDLEESSRWFIAAAELGYEPAFYNAAYALVNGHGVAEDSVAGRAWLDRALVGEERAYALGMLGDLAYYGQGQPVDFALALDFYVQAAQAGSSEAAWYAAYQYYYGEGTPEDEPAALPLLEQAVAGGELSAIGYLALLLSRGVGETAADPDRALAMALSGDDLGNGFASAVVGDFYRLGVGTEVNFELARAAYERGQARGNVDALYQLGDLAYFGRGVPQDYASALIYYYEALDIDPNHGGTLYSIAYMQMRGEGTEVDLASATELLEQTIAWRHGFSMTEAILLFGSPQFAGPQTDAVRARAHCIYVDVQGGPPDQSGDVEDHAATCARLAEELSAEDQIRAAEMAAAF